ncbi:MAG: DEAD/DEAH box helicase family protein [Nitrosotalea sp.]
MVNTKSLSTGETPLKLAEIITKMANKEWESGTFIEKVSRTTQDLLIVWDPKGSFADLRNINFHEGQWQAIINSVYVHEILKVKDVHDMYMSIYPELLQEMDLLDLKKDKYSHPKYCIKMATGTGKTWVLHALLIWHYLNSKHEEEKIGRFSKNFLIVAPGIIVYERLLDAYLGKRKEDGTRDFNTSDFKKFEELFLPPAYKDEVLGFVKSCVAQKEEIGMKVTGEGLIAITNWHLLAGEEDNDDNETPLDSPSKTIKKILPITPGTSAGHSLNELDHNYLRGKELDYLANLQDLVVFNDEAHHLGEWKKSDEVLDKKWQEALDNISEKKKDKFIQVDFSATPYTVTGSGQKRALHYFPHIIVNFQLVDAIKQGLVKTVAIDKRKEIAALPLEFKAEREGDDVKDLSDGQRVMLRAGITKLRILEEGFTKLDRSKHPKMLIVCEDTYVVPHVTRFLKKEGYSGDEITEIHSNKKGEIGEKEWDSVRQKLFEIDKHDKPRIIISVLMLREGFDVNNICVIVPLRSSSSYILLEQTIGRGLRLMWREPEYEDSKRENREKLLIKKEEPDNYMDILSIIEHPAFVEFYDRVLEGAIGKVKELPKKDRIVGDIINIGLKENYKDYDMFWPIILHDKEEEIISAELSVKDLEQFPIPIEQLKPLVNQRGDIFKSEELTVKTKFGEYSVTADIFTTKSYNTFIQKIVNAVSEIPVKVSNRTIKTFPIMQINSAIIAKLTDEYIRHKLFGEDFDPLEGNNWRILLLTESRIIQHIIKNVAKTVYDLQNNLKIKEATIVKKYFSELAEIKVRETYLIDVAKTIYPKIAFPSNKGGFEKKFMEFIDSDSKVNSFIKINEHYHDFSNVIYVRDDGLLAHYYPDFMIRIGNKIYLVETKAEKDLNNQNVKSKRLATIDWTDKINELKSDDRMDCTWNYVLLGENTFYSMSEKGASTEEILEYAKLTKAKVKGTLGDLLGIKEY